MDLSSFLMKKYIVQKKPTRFRKLLKKQLMSKRNNLTIIENAIAIKIFKSKQNLELIESLSYFKNGKISKLNADIFIISLGGLESPRILLQSFEKEPKLNKMIGEGLMDHPFSIIGNITIPKVYLLPSKWKKKFI